MPFYKPKIIVSKCLLNGNSQNEYLDMFFNKMSSHINLIPICPKELGINVEFCSDINFIDQKFHNQIKSNNVFAFILKECGIKIFTKEIVNEMNDIIIEEKALLNDTLRDDFFTKLFCLWEFEVLKQEKDINKLLEFHERNKYLFKLYSENNYEILDLLVTSYEENIFSLYNEKLRNIFEEIPLKESFKRIMLEMMKEYQEYTNLKERKFINELLNDYDRDYISRDILEFIVRNNLIRFNIERLTNQSLFERYPRQLR